MDFFPTAARMETFKKLWERNPKASPRNYQSLENQGLAFGFCFFVASTLERRG
jgi:hypothetical protein